MRVTVVVAFIAASCATWTAELAPDLPTLKPSEEVRLIVTLDDVDAQSSGQRWMGSLPQRTRSDEVAALERLLLASLDETGWFARVQPQSQAREQSDWRLKVRVVRDCAEDPWVTAVASFLFLLPGSQREYFTVEVTLSRWNPDSTVWEVVSTVGRMGTLTVWYWLPLGLAQPFFDERTARRALVLTLLLDAVGFHVREQRRR